MPFDYTCPICDETSEVEAYYTPARRGGRMEDSEPAESDVSPPECPACGHDWYEDVIDHIQDGPDEDDYPEPDDDEPRRSCYDYED